jgi:glyoxylase-like metal-dependent hydrolase (beta-lactamase superfamily II)
VEVDQPTEWLWCLRTPIVQAYAIREREGFDLVDTTTAGKEDEILAALAKIAGEPARVHEVLLTHGHDDHTGAAASLRARTGALIVASRVPDRLVDPGERLGWEHDASIVAAPGHTSGQVAAWFESDRVLIAGDALASYAGRPMVGVFNGDPTVAVASARRLANLDVEIACFGHGEPPRRDAAARLAELAR